MNFSNLRSRTKLIGADFEMEVRKCGEVNKELIHTLKKYHSKNCVFLTQFSAPSSVKVLYKLSHRIL